MSGFATYQDLAAQFDDNLRIADDTSARTDGKSSTQLASLLAYLILRSPFSFPGPVLEFPAPLL